MSWAASYDDGRLLHLGLLALLLMLEYLFFVLLETDKVEMQVLDSVFLEQILADQAAQVDAARLRHRVVLIERSRIALDSAEVASIVAHIQRLFVLIGQCVAEGVWDAPNGAAHATTSRSLPSRCVIIGRRKSVVVQPSAFARDLAVLDHDVGVRVGCHALMAARLGCQLGRGRRLSIHRLKFV